ncbi:hypothetical protein [Pantanalinema sp. GBBB05]|uniref:hypothetical protein n=1 Tax=Pantanalinema sp. GBBB05 TaxID=2604139 RepID=UPI001DD8BADA|nr:hypothetical protein [Pantanalinema sp. GBBB05]
MTIARLLRKTAIGRRPTCLAIVVFPDEAAVFQAYRLLHYHGISPENLAIVGQGYSSPERVGLMQPMQIATRKATTLGGAGLLIGVCVSVVLALFYELSTQELTWLASMVGVGAIVGSLTGALVGVVSGLLGEGTTVSIYRHHLRQGRYLLMMEGSEKLVRWGQEVLSYYSAPSPH